ncbi:MAG: hypothetical protein P8I27_00315 [Pirellulaceae bacterium]|nr:hypothetical protein [Pirellulaceae bacterium]
MSHSYTEVRRSQTQGSIFERPLMGHIKWKKQIANSDLPSDVKSRVMAVISNCRLSGSEKASVTYELLSHFEDGIAAGQSAETLLNDFGDSKVIAPLIQQSKRRSRPMWKKSLYLTGYTVSGLVAFYACVCIWFHWGKPSPSIDYLAQINQTTVERDDSEKAWPIYRPMWIKYKFSEGGQFNIPEMWYRPEADEADIRMIEAKDPNWDAAKTALSNHADLLQSFRDGAKKKYFGIPFATDPTDFSDEDFAAIHPNATREDFQSSDSDQHGSNAEVNTLMADSMIGVLLPHVQVLRTAARIFTVDLRIAIDEGDTERATQDIETMLGIARHAAEGPFLVCSLVGYSISGMAFTEIESTLTNHPEFFDDKQLARIQTAVADADIQDWFNLKGERLMVYDLVQRVYTDDGDGDGHMTRVGLEILQSNFLGYVDAEKDPLLENIESMATNLLGPVSLFLAATRKETIGKADRIFERMELNSNQPFWEIEDVSIEEAIQAEEDKYVLLSMLLPANEQVQNAMFRTKGRQEGVQGAMALLRAKKMSGEWPKTWQEIPKTVLKSPPLDQLTGEPLKFKIVEGQPLIYSVGNDRDDDGGKDRIRNGQPGPPDRTVIILSHTPDPEVDGDWILWPQVEEE